MSVILMGTMGIFSKSIGLSAETITFFRLILGASFMFLFLLGNGKTALIRMWPSWPVLINGAFLAGFIIFYVQAINYTSMANAIMLVYLAPLVASVIAHFFLGERLTPLSAGLIVLALFGFGMMMEWRIEFLQSSSEAIGIGFGLLGTVGYAGFILINRVISENIHVYTRTFYQLLSGAVIIFPFGLYSNHEIASAHIPWLIGTGLLPGFLAILFAVIALSQMPAATFGTIAYLEPVAVVIFGWTIFHETLSPVQIGGCLVIILSGIAKSMAEQRSNLQQERLIVPDGTAIGTER